MSDLGTLWIAAAGAAKENFTTAALYLAITHDPRPMIPVLLGIEWPEAAPLAAVDTLRASTQRTFWQLGNDGKRLLPDGRPDLLIEGLANGRALWDVWMEVKVDALESGDQLEVYERHWQYEHPGEPLRLAVLSPSRLVTERKLYGSGTIPAAWVPWTRIRGAIKATADDQDRWWTDLGEFLDAWGIARVLAPDQPEEGVDWVIDLLWEVNSLELKAHPDESLMWWPAKKTMKRNVEHHFRSGGNVGTSGGTLAYGLRATAEGWAWSVDVSRANLMKYARITFEEARSRAAALDTSWAAIAGSPVLARRQASRAALTSDADVVTWLRESVEQARDLGLALPRPRRPLKTAV